MYIKYIPEDGLVISNCFFFLSPDEGCVQPPGKELVEDLLKDLKCWEELCTKEAERFAGGNLLSCNEQIYHLYKRVEDWTDIALKVRGKLKYGAMADG